MSGRDDVETDSEPMSDDLDAALRSAVDSVEGGHQPEAPEPIADDVDPIEAETAAAKAERKRDEAGKFTKAEKPEVEAKAPEVRKPAAVKPGAAGAPATTSVSPEMKAPQSWKHPEAKAAWAALPEPVRVETLRREKEIARALQETADDRKYAQAMRQTVSPFEAQIRAEGSTPEAAVGKMLNMAMALRTAPPAYKADLVADTILSFGVPLEHLVPAIQRRLGGGQGMQPTGAPQQPQMLDPATIAKQVRESLMTDLQAQRESQYVERASSEVDSFLADKAFHGPDGSDYSADIRSDMADIIERATARGSPITLEQAYNRAAKEHPEVSKVLEQREAAQRAAKANASTQRSRAASSSVRSSPAVAPTVRQAGSSLDDDLRAALDSLR